VKILLVNPPAKIWSAPRVPPLGLAYIAAALEKAGHAVVVWDAGVDRSVPEFKGYDLVGATAVTPQASAAWSVLEKAKAAGAVTVLGGPHPTCLPEESLGKSWIDYVVRGEGEETIVDLARDLERGGKGAGITGISRRDAGGRVINEPDRQPIMDLDSLPFPALGLFAPLSRYSNSQPLIGRRSPSLPILTSRGCPYGCPFCFKGVFGRRFRARSPENVVAEWEVLVRKHGAAEIAVQDDAFNANPARAIRICRLIIERGLRHPWSAPNGIRADGVSEELMRAMKESGCERVAFGVEAGSQGMLDSIDKRVTLAQVENAFRLARRAGIRTMGFFMFGNQGETAGTAEATIRFAVALKPDWAQFTVATPYPGTELFETVRREGHSLVSEWDKYGHYTSGAFFRMGSVTPELVARAMRRAYRRFYLRPGYVLRRILDPGALGNLDAVIRGAWHLLARA
jgi:radical SAM superfamily enzyme YgiQ (UPF0313 family)